MSKKSVSLTPEICVVFIDCKDWEATVMTFRVIHGNIPL
jgi:hypothetical protein